MIMFALTTDHPASSYGMPVLLIDGEAYGAGDRTPIDAALASDVAVVAFRRNKLECGRDRVSAFLAQLPPGNARTRAEAYHDETGATP